MKIKFCLLLSSSLMLLMLFAASANGENHSTATTVLADGGGSSVEKIEAYHFHSNRQCNVCKTIGNNLDETINRYFSKEVAAGKIVYGHINVQSPENKEITNRYGAQGTSLWIGVYDKKGFHAENDQKIWFKLQNKEEFITYLKDLIEKRLLGEMN